MGSGDRLREEKGGSTSIAAKFCLISAKLTKDYIINVFLTSATSSTSP